MIIGFDAKRAAQNKTGLGNYSRFILRILSQQHPENEYHLYIPDEKRIPYLGDIPPAESLYHHFPKTMLWKKLSSIWRVWSISNDIAHNKTEIYHGLSNELPLNFPRKGIKSIVTIHDVIFKHYPQYYKWIDRKIYDYKFRRACEKSDHIIAISEYTKQEIIRYYNIAADKISVVYQGCDPAFAADVTPEKLQEVKAKYSLPDRFLLYVGSIEERKNLLLAVKALNNINEQICLVAVGRKTAYTDEINRYISRKGKPGIKNDIVFLHNVPFADLPSLYKLATTFIYPSRIEGFGIPLLEAISAGIPVIGCTGSCLEEAGGPYSIYVSPDDEKAMADAIVRTFNDTSLREKMITEGRKHAEHFNDRKLCQNIIDIYKKVL